MFGYPKFPVGSRFGAERRTPGAAEPLKGDSTENSGLFFFTKKFVRSPRDRASGSAAWERPTACTFLFVKRPAFSDSGPTPGTGGTPPHLASGEARCFVSVLSPNWEFRVKAPVSTRLVTLIDPKVVSRGLESSISVLTYPMEIPREEILLRVFYHPLVQPNTSMVSGAGRWCPRPLDRLVGRLFVMAPQSNDLDGPDAR
jgi:hypothetical protein